MSKEVNIQKAQQDKKALFSELGLTGLNQYSGRVSEEWLTDFSGDKGIKKIKEMRDNDPVIGAISFSIKNLIKQVKWRVNPASDKRKDKQAAEFVESCLYDMSSSWSDILSEILSFLDFGWSYHEIIYKRRLGRNSDGSKNSKYNDGRIGWRKLSIRSQESKKQWVFDDEGSLRGLIQNCIPDYKDRFIPIEKALLFTTEKHKGNPEGRSIYRNAFRPWHFKKNIEEIEGIGIERDLAGLPVATVPAELLNPNATSDEVAVLTEIKKIVTRVRRNAMEGVVFPSEVDQDGNPTGFKFQLLSSGGRRQFNTSEIITRYDQRMAMSVLADFILLGHEKVGSFALSSDKTALFSTAIGAFLDHICEVFNTYAIVRLFELNTFPGITDLPELAHGDIEKPEIDKLGNFINSLTQAGIWLGDIDTEQHLRSLADLPERKEERPSFDDPLPKKNEDMKSEKE